ncbi:MAG: phosphoribosylglycinamide formyltransferase, partial [Hyphomicrobiales bacterium]
RVAVLISGGGTNLQSLIDATSAANFPAQICLVISNKADAYGLTRAQKAGIDTRTLPHKDYESRSAFDEALDKALKDANIELICLAGFMRLLTPVFIEKWTNKILNIHPSLLPSFPGLHVHQRAIDAGVRFSGCTVHIVREEMDVGPIIAQAVVPLAQDDTADTLAARILASEHEIYPKALEWIASGQAEIIGERVFLDQALSVPDSQYHPN